MKHEIYVESGLASKSNGCSHPNIKLADLGLCQKTNKHNKKTILTSVNSTTISSYLIIPEIPSCTPYNLSKIMSFQSRDIQENLAKCDVIKQNESELANIDYKI